MNDEPTKDLATRAFQKRVLDEFAAVRREQMAFRDELRSEFSDLRGEQAAFRDEVRIELSALRAGQTAMRQEITEIRAQQSATAQDIARLYERLTSLQERVDERLRETRPIWEALQAQVQRLMEKFDGVILEFAESRGDLKIHGRRIGELERRTLS